MTGSRPGTTSGPLQRFEASRSSDSAENESAERDKAQTKDAVPSEPIMKKPSSRTGRPSKKTKAEDDEQDKEERDKTNPHLDKKRKKDDDSDPNGDDAPSDGEIDVRGRQSSKKPAAKQSRKGSGSDKKKKKHKKQKKHGDDGSDSSDFEAAQAELDMYMAKAQAAEELAHSKMGSSDQARNELVLFRVEVSTDSLCIRTWRLCLKPLPQRPSTTRTQLL